MDNLPTLLQKKIDDGVTDPAELGREVARAVPRAWRISVFAVVKVGIPRDQWKTLFQAFFEEQRRKAPKFKKGKGKKGEPAVEEDEQLSFGLD